MRPLVLHDVSLVFDELTEDILFQSAEPKIAQILRNLISNAVKFTEHSEVRVSYELTGQGYECPPSVPASESRPRTRIGIFREFAQVNNVIQSEVKGTRLVRLPTSHLSGVSHPDAAAILTCDIPVIIHTSQQFREFDFEALADRHCGILPEGEAWPPESPGYIGQLLGEPYVFGREEPTSPGLQ